MNERTKANAETAKPAMKRGAPEGNTNNRFSIKDGDEYKGDNYNLCKSRGTSAGYLTSVIARDHPQIHEDMKAGKYRSVREAAIDAGIVKPREQWTAPGPVEKLALSHLTCITTHKLLANCPTIEVLIFMDDITDLH